jgi:hypothetical protein
MPQATLMIASAINQGMQRKPDNMPSVWWL